MSQQATTRGVAAANAAIAARRPNALVSTVLRTGSVHAREIMAERAWPGHSPVEVEAWAASAPQKPPRDADARALGDLARVLALQPGVDGFPRPDLGRAVLEALAAGTGWSGAPRAHVELLAQLRLLDGDDRAALLLAEDRRVRPEVADSLRADALNPSRVPGADGASWAKAFSRALHGQALAPYLPPEGDAPHFDLLQTEARPPVAGAGTVTVLMSAYRPGPALLTAVGSVLAQTWQDLELFVVDDASGTEGPHVALLDEVEALDRRVRVIRKAVNGGTYRARNTALRLARGDYVVVLDSDDRWHPQTLELCLAPLLQDRRLLATRAQGVRIPESLVLTRPGYQPRFPSAATVVFRSREVLGRIGFFDPTRKGADTEFARRLEASCGPVVQDVPATTTLLRAGDSTLSAGEFRAGWRHPARHQYKSLYGAWHERIRSGAASPYLDPALGRVFPEPLRWEGPADVTLARPRSFDLCLAGDWRRFGGPQRSMVEEIRAARSAGLQVAVMHLEALRFMGGRDVPVTPELVRLVEEGEVTWVLPDDDVDIRVLMVRYPPILQYPPRLSRKVRAEQVLVMANQAPLEVDGSDQRYVVSDVTARTRELFGAPVSWVPQSPWIRRLLVEQDPEVPMVPWDNPGLIDVAEWHVRPSRPPRTDGRVVIGRHSRDDRIKFPSSWAELERGYAFPPGHEVRILGGERTVEALRRAQPDAVLPANWTVLAHGSQDVKDFLAGLDFYLYLDNVHAHESFGRTLLEAAASGVLTIAHPKHEPTFGATLDYAEPGEAQRLVASYVADPQVYTERVRRAQDEVRRRFSHRSFLQHLTPFLREGRASQPPTTPRAESTALPRAGALLRLGRPDLDGGAGDHVDGDGLEARTLTLRSVADAERADTLTLVHRPGAEVGAWLRGMLTAVAEPARLSACLEHAPASVTAVVLRADGWAHVWLRCEGGWRQDGWPARAAPSTLVLPTPGPTGREPAGREQM